MQAEGKTAAASSTVPGMVRYARWQFAPFPLTLTLSPKEREQGASRSGELGSMGTFTAERLVHPFPKGERWGNQPPHGAARMSSTYWDSRFQASGIAGDR